MDWQSLIGGVTLFVGLGALGLWANESRYRQAKRFRQQREQHQAEEAAQDIDN